MALIYWNSKNLEIQLLCLLSLPEPALSLLGDHQIIYYKHHHFPSCYFPLIYNTPSPKPPGLGRHRTRLRLPKFSLVLVYLAQKGSKGKRGRTHLCFFHALLSILAMSPHPTCIPWHGPWPPSSVHSTGSSASAAPAAATRALPALQAGGICFGPASNDP